MKGIFIFTIILLAISFSWERLILNNNSNSVFKNRTRFINSRKSRIIYSRYRSQEINPNTYKRSQTRLNRFPNGKRIYLCPQGRKISTPRRIKSSRNFRYRYRYQY